MFVEVVNYDELEDGGADLEVECDSEFIELAKEQTGEEDQNSAVREFIIESILDVTEEID